jgi:hypothetical protein
MKFNKITQILLYAVHFNIFATEVAQKHAGTGYIAFHYREKPL